MRVLTKPYRATAILSAALPAVMWVVMACGRGAEEVSSPRSSIGHGLFLSNGCAACHGEQGRGDGPISKTLDPAPRDLHDPSSYRYGNSVAAIAAVIEDGITGKGSGMPSFVHIPEADRLEIAYYIASLQGSLPARVTGVDVSVPDAPAIADAPAHAKKLRTHKGIGGDFALTDHQGERFRMSDVDGRIRLLFFGYASCPDVCPMTLSKIAQVRRLVGEARRDIMTLFVSVDSQRDGPESLSRYLSYFDVGDVVGLTGTPEEIDAMVELFRGFYEVRESGSAAPYLIDHTSYLFLIDRPGRVRAIFRHSTDPDQVAGAIRVLLDEQPPEAS